MKISRRGKGKKVSAKNIPRTGNKVDRAQTKVIQSLESKVKKILPELKVLAPTSYTAKSSVTIASPENRCINPLTLGTGAFQRVGGKVRFVRLVGKYQIRDTAGLGSTSSTRVMIVVQKRNNAATTCDLNGNFDAGTGIANSGLLYHGDGTTIPGTNSIYNPMGNILKNNFRVLYDKTHVCNVVVGYATNRTFNIRLNFVTDYSANDQGTAVDILTNALYFVCISDSTTTNAIVLSYNYALFYNDS